MTTKLSRFSSVSFDAAVALYHKGFTCEAPHTETQALKVLFLMIVLLLTTLIHYIGVYNWYNTKLLNCLSNASISLCEAVLKVASH